MTTSVLDTRSGHSDRLHDPLYDMEVSEEQLFFYKVVAAFSLAFRSKRPLARVFKLYNLTQQDIARFEELFPEAAKKMLEAAFIAAFFMPTCDYNFAKPVFFICVSHSL